MRHGYIASNRSGSTTTMSCPATTCHSATSALRQPCGAPRVIASHLRREYSSPGCSGSTSTTSCVWVPWLVARLVVDYFAYVAPPGASARHTVRRAAHRRLLRLRRASRCLGSSRGSSCRLSSTTSPTLRDRVPRHVAARHAARRAARRRLLRLRRASRCLCTSRGPSRDSSSTTSTTPHVWVPRHIARLVTRLVAPLVID
jgi:hypothetical protein